jgi:hypothetical protein
MVSAYVFLDSLVRIVVCRFLAKLQLLEPNAVVMESVPMENAFALPRGMVRTAVMQ